MERWVSKRWAKKDVVRVMNLEENFFFVRFFNQEDYSQALFEGPWMIADHYFLIQRWRCYLYHKKLQALIRRSPPDLLKCGRYGHKVEECHEIIGDLIEKVVAATMEVDQSNHRCGGGSPNKNEKEPLEHEHNFGFQALEEVNSDDYAEENQSNYSGKQEYYANSNKGTKEGKEKSNQHRDSIPKNVGHQKN
ncbi:hypothetical protein Ahy_A03g010840 [Arachis hypogaea]|uniref:DUF4283 domain-containing protein n=1 Tax=Arachis hypogaea TaxID=3818 RepID=A0A445DNQ0_ARAHY|nr:hypothetical protein Ahy_A03g010840 [Arachis hypogaea]